MTPRGGEEKNNTNEGTACFTNKLEDTDRDIPDRLTVLLNRIGSRPSGKLSHDFAGTRFHTSLSSLLGNSA